jgi:hypothetical protein
MPTTAASCPLSTVANDEATRRPARLAEIEAVEKALNKVFKSEDENFQIPVRHECGRLPK